MTSIFGDIDFKALLSAPISEQAATLERVNVELAKFSPQERVMWALKHLPGNHALSSSFGIQSALMLHLLTQECADIPVVLTDTGHLFPQTYDFIDRLTERLSLNLNVYQSEMSPAWQKARFGNEWEQGVNGLDAYNKRNKVEPMQRALSDLKIGTWFSGLRSQQASSREGLPIIEIRGMRYKFLPIIDLNNKQVHQYLTQFDLPYHPLWEEGYVSLGDVHSTSKLEAGMSEEDTRFNGLKRECGLHFEI